MLKQKILYSLLIFSLLNIFDLGITLWLIQHFGPTVELNPFFYQLFYLHPSLAISYKLGTIILFLLIIPFTTKQNFTLAYYGSQFLVGIFSIIGLYHFVNLFLIFSA